MSPSFSDFDMEGLRYASSKDPAKLYSENPVISESCLLRTQLTVCTPVSLLCGELRLSSLAYCSPDTFQNSPEKVCLAILTTVKIIFP